MRLTRTFLQTLSVCFWSVVVLPAVQPAQEPAEREFHATCTPESGQNHCSVQLPCVAPTEDDYQPCQIFIDHVSMKAQTSSPPAVPDLIVRAFYNVIVLPHPTSAQWFHYLQPVKLNMIDATTTQWMASQQLKIQYTNELDLFGGSIDCLAEGVVQNTGKVLQCNVSGRIIFGKK